MNKLIVIKRNQKNMIVEIALGGMSQLFGSSGIIISTVIYLSRVLDVSIINGSVSPDEVSISLTDLLLDAFVEFASETSFRKES